MEINESRQGRVVVLAPSGRIDHQSSDAFQDRLLAAIRAEVPSAVVVDLGGVEYVSSVGLRALIIGAKHSKAVGGTLAVADLQPVVREIFQISRFDHVIPTHDTLATAVAAVA